MLRIQKFVIFSLIIWDESKILYKAYINLESKKNPKKFYDFIEEDLADKTILKPNPEKNKVIKTN